MYDLLFKNTKNIIIILFLLLKIPPLAAENNNLLVYAAASTNTRGIFAGGSDDTDDIEFITIASAGNAAAFGDLSAGMKRNAGGCDSHGGIQG